MNSRGMYLLMHKKNKHFYLLLALFLLIANPAHAVRCQSLFSNFDTQNFDPEEALKSAGLNPQKIFLQFTKIAGGDDAPSWELVIKEKTENPHINNEIGLMSAWAIDDSFKIWRTDTSSVAQTGKGLGQLMYLLMAAKFFIAFPSKRFISPDHSDSANQMWEALVRKGFAKKFSIDESGREVLPSEELGFIYEIDAKSLGKKIKDYVRRFKAKSVSGN